MSNYRDINGNDIRIGDRIVVAKNGYNDPARLIMGTVTDTGVGSELRFVKYTDPVLHRTDTEVIGRGPLGADVYIPVHYVIVAMDNGDEHNFTVGNFEMLVLR